MPAPKTIATSAQYHEIRRDSRALNEASDCSVVALTVVTGRPYPECHAAMKAAGRQDRAGARQHQIEKALNAMGFRIERVALCDIIASYPAPHCNALKNVTTHHPDRFAAQWPAGAFLMYTRGHVAGIKDGVNHDWTRGSAKRVISMYRVVPV